MGNETAAKRLTLDDPVGKETLEKFAELEQAQVNTAMHLMGIKREEVRLLAVDSKIENERHRIFEKLLMERGLPPATQATIDAATGKINVIKTPPGQGPVASLVEPSPATHP